MATITHRKVIPPLAAFVSVLTVASFLVDWRTGIMAGLLAAGFMFIPDILAGVVPEPHMPMVRNALRPLAVAALLVLVTSFPYLLTPPFLAPTVTLDALSEANIKSQTHRRLAVNGIVAEVEFLPFAIGSDNIVVVGLKDEAAYLRALYAVGEGERAPSTGARIRLVGVVQGYGSPQLRFVARQMSVVAPAP